MRFLETRLVDIIDIEAPANLAERTRAPHVTELARSIKQLGGEPLAPLLVDATRVAGRWRLVCGRDRFAACRLLGVERLPVRLVADATPADLKRLEASENLHRRAVSPEERARLLREFIDGRGVEIVAERKAAPDMAARAWAERFERERVAREADPAWQARAKALAAGEAGSVAGPTAPAPVDDAPQELRTSVHGSARPPGRPGPVQSPRSQAIAEIAAIQGVSPDAIRKDLARHAAPTNGAPAKPAPKPLIELELAQLARISRRAVQLAGQVGDARIIAAADALERAVQVRLLARLPADVRRQAEGIMPTASNEPTGPEPPEGRFDGDLDDAGQPVDVLS